jgi:nitrate/nitrite-specific signal transduction histidine kinase
MKNKLFIVTAGFGAVIILLTCFFYFSIPVQNNQSRKSQQIVALNEISQLVEAGDTASAQKKIAELDKSLRITEITEQDNKRILVVGATNLVFLLAVSAYIYFAVLRPFDKLKGFADSIARGNFDVPLKYERSNYFGKFTWAFDSMRREITKA